SVAQGCQEFGRAFLHRFENVARELAIMRSLLDSHEIVRSAELFPDLGELRSQQVPKQRANTHIGEIITFPSNRAAIRRIVSVLGVVERLLHKPGERLRAVFFDFCAHQSDQRRISVPCIQRPTLNVQRSMFNLYSLSIGRWTLGVERWTFAS